MPRAPRIARAGAVYLVSARGGEASPLFHDPQDYDTYLSLLAEYQARHGFRLFAYCLLPESVWLCLEPASGTSLSAIMHDVTTAYTRSVNRRYGRSGSLFRERFKETVVEKAPYLLSATAYLHSLPRQAGLVQELAGYPFSSAQRYAVDDRAGTFSAGEEVPHVAGHGARLEMDAEIQEVLRALAAEYPQVSYTDYVNGLSGDDLAELFSPRVVGSAAFVSMAKAKLTNTAISAPSSSQLPASSSEIVERDSLPSRPRHLGLVMASLAAVVFSGVVVASLHQRIGALQQTILALSEENGAMFRTRYSLAIQRDTIGEVASLEGTEWDVRLIPLLAQGGQAIAQDHLTFTRRQVASATLATEGFSAANYTMVVQPDGTLNWETMQMNPSGEMISWQGEWQGPVMRGVLTRQTSAGAPQHFTFVGVSRKPAAVRSET